MGASKIRQYNQKQLAFASTAKALGHPARVAIIQFLSVSGIAINKNLMEVTKLSDPSISRHLNELKKAGFVIELFMGKQQYHRLSSNAEELLKSLQAITIED